MSKFVIALRPDKIEQVLATGVCEPEWIRYVRITPTTVRRAARILDSNPGWISKFSWDAQRKIWEIVWSTGSESLLTLTELLQRLLPAAVLALPLIAYLAIQYLA